MGLRGGQGAGGGRSTTRDPRRQDESLEGGDLFLNGLPAFPAMTALCPLRSSVTTVNAQEE